MTKVVYNNCYGGFGLSHKAVMRYAELKGITLYAFDYDKKRLTDEEAEKEFSVNYCTTEEYSNEHYWSMYDLSNDRSDPVLVQVVEELGDKADGSYASLKIREIAEGTLYRIDEYDGNESVMTSSEYDWKIS